MKKPASARAKNLRKQPSQARSRDTFKSILEAAARLLARNGYAATTTNQVAHKAGVSIGTLYEYFPNKDAIVLTLLDQHLADAEQSLAFADEAFVARALTTPLVETIEQLIDALVGLHEPNPRLHRVLFEEARQVRGVRARLELLEQRFVALTCALFRGHPEVRVADPSIAAQIVVQCIEALVHAWALLPTGEPQHAPAYRRELVMLVLSYLSAPPRSPS